MKQKHLHTYRISRGYRRCIVWVAHHRTRARIGTLTLTPGPQCSRRQRYDEICRFLKPMVPLPAYRPTASEEVA